MNKENVEQPTELDSWNTRIERFSKIIGVEKQVVEAKLAEKPFDLTQDTPLILEMLSDEDVFPFGDIRKIFGDDIGISLPKLRMAVKFLRGPKQSKEKRDTTEYADPDLLGLYSKYGIKTKLSDLGIEELLPYYKPEKRNVIHEILKEKYGKYGPIIAFKPNTKEIAIEETIDYVSDLEIGIQTADDGACIEVDGELVRAYAIGVTPNEWIDEDPLFVGEALRKNRSTINRIDWSNCDLPIRQFLRILGPIRKDINVQNRVEIAQLLSYSFNELKKMFPEAYLQFKDMKEAELLPNLKVSLNRPTKKQDPFSINKKY